MKTSLIVNFFTTYWLDLVIVVGIILLLYIIKKLMIRYDKNNKVKNIIIQLCIEAEKYLGSKTGELKKRQVIVWFRTRYPFISAFISEQMLSGVIDNIVTYINNYLTENEASLEGSVNDSNITLRIQGK